MEKNENNIFAITIEDMERNPRFGLQAVSLVEYPAVEKNFLCFKNSTKPKRLAFDADSGQHVITGVALLADTPIYRWDFFSGEYYVVFPRDVIKQLVQKYSQDNIMNMTSLQHDELTYTMKDCTLIESYFVNKERGILPKEFSDIPDGSWIVSYKVNSEELWQAIKDGGEINGFSVEVFSNLKPVVDTRGLHEKIGAPDDDGGDFWDNLLESIGMAAQPKKKGTDKDIEDIMDRGTQLAL